jgi:hypothetical protein
MHIGYVATSYGTILLQLPDASAWGFCLSSDDQTWPGGHGACSSWEALADDDPRITADDRARLEWLLADTNLQED